MRSLHNPPPSSHDSSILAKVNKRSSSAVFECLTFSLYVSLCVCARMMVCVFPPSSLTHQCQSLSMKSCGYAGRVGNRFSVKLTQSNVARCLLEINLLPRPPPTQLPTPHPPYQTLVWQLTICLHGDTRRMRDVSVYASLNQLYAPFSGFFLPSSFPAVKFLQLVN